MYVREINIDRMHRLSRTTSKYLHDRTVEMIGWQYISWPDLAPATARDARKSPMHDRLAQLGASFATSAGWEWPNWFAPEGVEPRQEHSWGRANSFEYIAAEHRATREGVVMMDMTHMAKFMVQGDDAENVLNRICANDVAVEPGESVYTQWLNERGRIEADLTVSRLAEDRFLVVSGDVIHQHTEAWMKRNTPPGSHFFVTDVTSGYTILNIQGPRSRELISSLTNADMSNAAFPYRAMREIEIGYARVHALRLTYVGELGWELYIPTEFTLHVFDRIVKAGKAMDLRHAGLGCLETLRLEKAYRDYCHDIDNMDTPLEAGLRFAVKFDKPGGFIGREALLRQIEEGVKVRLVQFLVEDPEPLLHAEEPIYRDGVRVGYIKSGGYGHTLGGAVGLGPVENAAGVTPDFVNSGRYEIEISGKRYPARASLRPMYDPKGLRIRS